MLVGACSSGPGSRRSPDASSADASSPDGARDASADSGEPGGLDAADPDRPERGTFELPRVWADPSLTRRLSDGPAFLAGGSGDGCSRGTPGADHWCAFFRPGAAADSTELWVLNATRATTGELKCDGTSPDCLRLTATLWTGQPLWGPSHPAAHRFSGDTLIFHADAASGMRMPYEGGIWAWRPGWSTPRRLTGPAGVNCSVDPRTAVAVCVDDAIIHRDGPGLFDRPRLTSFNLLAGKIADEAGGPLPVVSRVSTGVDDLWWRSRLAPNGEHVVFGNYTTEGQVVQVARVGQAGGAPPATILKRAITWEIAHDGTKLYFLAGFDPTVGEVGAGTLMLADFPSGGNLVELQKDVISYDRLGAHDEVFSDVDRGLLLERVGSEGQVNWSILRDRDKPSELFGLGVDLRGTHVATDLRHTIYLSGRGNPIAFVARNDGSGSCLLTSDIYAETYGLHFTHSGRRAIWIEYGRNDSISEEGWHAQPETCGDKTKFGDYVLGYSLFGDQYVVFEGGEFEDTTSWLQYTRIRLDGTQPLPLPVVVKEHADSHVGIFTAGGETWMVFHVWQTDPAAGLYLHGPMRRD